MRNLIIATGFEAYDFPATENRLLALRPMFDAIRTTIDCTRINPQPGVWNWEDAVTGVQLASGFGFKVAPTICFAPPHWTETNEPTYKRFHGDSRFHGDRNGDGCTRWQTGATDVMQIEFDDSKPYCTNPPHIRVRGPVAIEPPNQFIHSPAFQFGAEYAKRFGPYTWASSIWNEPDGESGLFWPPSRLGQHIGLPRVVDEVIIPMQAGIRTWEPGAQFIGPECENAGGLETLLNIEVARRRVIWDALSYHPYPWSADWRHVFARINEFDEVLRAHDHLARPRLWSECGFMDAATFIREALKRPEIRTPRMIGIGDFRQWWEAGTWEADRPVLNAKGREFHDLVRELRGGDDETRWHI